MLCQVILRINGEHVRAAAMAQRCVTLLAPTVLGGGASSEEAAREGRTTLARCHAAKAPA
jgi:hypothetical protein